MNGSSSALGMYIEEERQQRAGLLLRDVAYRIHAQFDLQDDKKHIHNYPHLQCSDSQNSENSYIKFSEMFKRRASKGQCFNQPYLGTREFSCAFSYVEPSELDAITTNYPPIQESKELGWMLYDMDFSNIKEPTPKFFNASMINGTIQIPAWHSEGVRG